ncbi:unnamed protein product [Closterium sp. NIES-65]|nr:unnamed protein product [Closterium sp. NIES-65]
MKDALILKGDEPLRPVDADSKPSTAAHGVAMGPNLMMSELGKMVDAAVSASLVKATSEGRFLVTLPDDVLQTVEKAVKKGIDAAVASIRQEISTGFKVLKTEVLKLIEEKLNASGVVVPPTEGEKRPPPVCAEPPSGHERQTKRDDESPGSSLRAAEHVLSKWEFGEEADAVPDGSEKVMEAAAPNVPVTGLDGGKRPPSPTKQTETTPPAKIPRAANDADKQGEHKLTLDGVMRYLQANMPDWNEEEDDDPIGNIPKVDGAQQTQAVPEISEEKDGKHVEVQDHSNIVPDKLGKKFGTDVEKWHVELALAKRIPTGVWSVMNELTLDRYDK